MSYDTATQALLAKAWFEGRASAQRALDDHQPPPVNPYLPKARDHTHHWTPRPAGRNSYGESMFVLRCERCEEEYDPIRAREPETTGAEVTDD